MEARLIRPALAAAVLLVSMGARHRTPNFIIEAPDAKLAQDIGAAAEKYRRTIALEWLGKAMPDWEQPCTTTVRVGANLGAGGATSFVFDQGEVFGWRMTIQGSRQRLFDSVLPHEILHTILASHFRCPLPRWADEGAASSVEHSSERAKHHKMLHEFLRTGRGIAFKEMFAMKQYPRDIMPLYAQGHSLASFLIQTGGKRKFLDFLAGGMKSNDWPSAIRRHYGISDAGALQNTWLAWVRKGSPAFTPPKSHPAAAPSADMLAGGGLRRRPEPNLIYHIRDKQSPAYAPGSVIAGRGVSRTSGNPNAKTLPASGWYASASQPPAPTAMAVAEASKAEAVRNHVTRPQPFQRPRQRILEWSGE